MPETHYAKAGDGVHVAYQVDGDGPVDIIQVPGFVSNVEVYTQFPAYEIEARRFGSFARRIRTLGLVLLGSFARMFPAPDYDIGGDAAEMAALVSDLEERWGDGSSLRRFVPQYIDTHPEALAPLAQYERQSASPGAAREHPRPRGADRRAADPRIDRRAGAGRARDRRPDDSRAGRYLAEHIPGARLRELPFVDHILLEESELNVLLDEIEEFVTGIRPVRDATLDRILATVLFTDIVDSTARAADLGDAKWKQTLDRHDEITSTLVERHRGRVVKTTGDGVLATFDGPARAVQCGLAAREAIRPLGIDIRAGVHTGECEQRGDDIGGIAVHIGARVAGLAGPGEVFVSRTVKDLVAGSGLRFDDRGEHTLKGVPDSWQIYAAAT